MNENNEGALNFFCEHLQAGEHCAGLFFRARAVSILENTYNEQGNLLLVFKLKETLFYAK